MYIEYKEFLKKIRLKNGKYVPKWLLGDDLSELHTRAEDMRSDRVMLICLLLITHIAVGIGTGSITSQLLVKHASANLVIYISIGLTVIMFSICRVFIPIADLRLNIGEKQKFEAIGRLLSLKFIPVLHEDRDISLQNAASIVLKLSNEQMGAEKRYESAELSEDKSAVEVELDHARSVFTEHFHVMKSVGLLPNITRGDLFIQKVMKNS